jgi:hypothetical protein
MPIRHGFIASSVALAPTVSLSAATNFNQSIATLNATVSANFYSTTVKFQYNKTNNFSSFTEVNAATTPITGQSVSSYANITGLDENSTYYFRCVATNAIGTTTTSVSSFVTWAKQTFSKTASGTWNITIPTVTPTGGSIVVPSITSVQLVGGGGGGYNQGGGGGGGAGYSSASLTFASGSSTAISVVVGAGGGAATAGGSSSISNLGVSAAGGGGASTDIYNGRAGSSGSGNIGGLNTASNDKDGVPISWAGGGGGGNAGAGANGDAAFNAGGAGGGASSATYGGGTFGGGGGGDGGATGGSSSNGASGGGNYGVGGQGEGSGSGSAGRAYFQYYASTALA